MYLQKSFIWFQGYKNKTTIVIIYVQICTNKLWTSFHDFHFKNMSMILMFNTVFYCHVGIKNNLSKSIKCDSGLENLSLVKCHLYINKSKYILNRAKYWCQEQSEMTIKKYLLITFLKNSCSNHVEKLNENTWWGLPYSVNFSSYSVFFIYMLNHTL